ncbi:MAG: site-specific DNA-methyltransferase [Saprospiraceae bacterium]
MKLNHIYTGDALKTLRTLPDNSVNCCVTSPPYYGLRDYGHAGQLGLEETQEKYVANMVQVFSEVRRVLKNNGVLWLNIGDSYAGGKIGRDDNHTQTAGINRHNGKLAALGNNGVQRKPTAGLKPKDIIGIPWMLAFALRADGWYLRQDIIWHKPNPMPESVTDRCTKAHEYIFLLSKSERYWYDAEAIAEKAITKEGRPAGIVRDRVFEYNSKLSAMGRQRGGSTAPEPETRNRRSVWSVPTKPYSEAHFATFPVELPRLCIAAGCPEGGAVIDPFFGAGTTGLAALQLNRKFIGIELNPEYVALANRRLMPLLSQKSLFETV